MSEEAISRETDLGSRAVRGLKPRGCEGGASDKAWARLCVAAIVVHFVCLCTWVIRNPHPRHWDNAEYLNQTWIDVHAFRAGGWGALGRSLLSLDQARPPGYRLVVLPFTLIGLTGATPVRLVSLALFALTLWLIFDSGRAAFGAVAGALAVLLFALGPFVWSSMEIYGTETTLYLAVAGLARRLLLGLNRPLHAVALGLWIGLGLLSKASFVLVAGPMVLVAICWPDESRRWLRLMRDGAIALIVAAGVSGWFLVPNWLVVQDYARQAQLSVRASHGPLSIDTFILWMRELAHRGTGHWMAVMLAVIVVGSTTIAITGAAVRARIASNRRALVIYAAGALPLIAMQLLFSRNHGVRIITPAFIPAAIALAGVAGITGLMRRKWFFLVMVLAVLGQLVWPIGYRSVVRAEFWDWEPVRAICRQRGLTAPSIAYLGSGTYFNPPMIQQPWVRRNERAKVTWLWRYEDEPIDWQRVVDRCWDADVLLLAPGYVGDKADKQDRDNAPVAEFYDRVLRAGRFGERVEVEMGVVKPIRMWVFFSRGGEAN